MTAPNFRLPRVERDGSMTDLERSGFEAFEANVDLIHQGRLKGPNWLRGWWRAWARAYGQGVRAATLDPEREGSGYPPFSGADEAWCEGFDDAAALDDDDTSVPAA